MPKEESKEKKGKEKKGKKVTGVEENPESSQKTKTNKGESESGQESKVEPMAPCTIIRLGIFYAFVLVFTIAALIFIWPKRNVWRSREAIEVMIDSVQVKKDSITDLADSVTVTLDSLAGPIASLTRQIDNLKAEKKAAKLEVESDATITVEERKNKSAVIETSSVYSLVPDSMARDSHITRSDSLNDSLDALQSSLSDLSDTLDALNTERFTGDPGYRVRKILAPHLSQEANFFLVVLLGGMLGSVIASFHSFVDRMTGKKKEELEKRQTWGYFLRPMFGGALALVFYFAINGGLMTSNLGSRLVTPYGLAAVGALVGMFAEKAMAKLKELTELLFQPRKRDGDESGA